MPRVAERAVAEEAVERALPLALALALGRRPGGGSILQTFSETSRSQPALLKFLYYKAFCPYI